MPISKYKRIVKKLEPVQGNEIHVKVRNLPFVYARYAAKLLFDNDEDEIYLTSTGPAVSNAIKVCEYLRRNVKSIFL